MSLSRRSLFAFLATQLACESIPRKDTDKRAPPRVARSEKQKARAKTGKKKSKKREFAARASSRAAKAKLDARPVRVDAISYGPDFHWGGYYDKIHFDLEGRHVVGMRSPFEDRFPTASDAIEVGLIDLERRNTWKKIGESRAWSWQQGCMLQWRPGYDDQIVWNDRDGDRLVTRIYDVRRKKTRTIKSPFATLSPDGNTAWTVDFLRLFGARKGYGYPGEKSSPSKVSLSDDGIFSVDMRKGERQLAVPLSTLVAYDRRFAAGNLEHFAEHLLCNPSGTRIAFLHRIVRGRKMWKRFFTVNVDGTELRLINDGWTSHFIWRDDDTLLAWAERPKVGQRFYAFRDRPGAGAPEVIGDQVLSENGHITVLPGGRFLLNDTYVDASRLQHLHLYDVAQKKKIPLGSFYAHRRYARDLRCDLHPRASRDGRKVVIDSPHGDNGRQMYVLDIGNLIS